MRCSPQDVANLLGRKLLHCRRRRQGRRRRTTFRDLRAGALSGREKQVYQLLDDQPRSVDDLLRVGDIPVSALSATLLSLELRRLARKTPGGYVRAT